MNRWTLRFLNLALLLALLAAIPFGIRAYTPIEKNNKGVEALENREYDKAIDLLREAIQHNPENQVFRRNLLAAYNSKAIELERNGHDADALAWYEKAIALEPKNQTILRNYISTLNNLAVARSKTKEFADSQDLFERATKGLEHVSDAKIRNEIRHNYSALLTLWGAELMKRDQFDGSRVAFEQSLTLDPKNAVANIYLGDLFYEVNDYSKAQKYYAAALPLDKENATYLQNRLQMIEDESKVEGLFRQIKDPQGRFNIQSVDYTNGVPTDEILEMLNDAYEKVGQRLGIYPARAVSVKIYNSEDFRKISKLPEWAIGIFDGKMRLKVEDIQSAPSQVRDLLFHEYTHAVLAMNIKQRVPAWFHEGIAQLMEPQFTENPRARAEIVNALSRNTLNFSVLEDSFKEIHSKRDAETAYMISVYFVNHLQRRYGTPRLTQWIKELSTEDKFEEAFAKVFGVTLKKAQEDWVKTQLRA